MENSTLLKNRIKSAPQDVDENSIATKAFHTLYGVNNINNAEVKIKIDNLIQNLFTLYPFTNHKGLVFHYGYDVTNKELFYIIGLGEQDSSTLKVTHFPFPAHTNGCPYEHYFLLDGKGSKTYQILELPANSGYCDLKNAYENNFLYDNGTGPTHISAIAEHPYQVYHEGKELFKFYSEYQNSMTHLYFAHRAAKGHNGTEDYHIPFVLAGDANGMFDLTNNVDQNAPYKGKALDVGHLCPPYCGNAPFSLCP